MRGEIDHSDSSDLDAATRFALDWFENFGWGAKGSGEAIKLAQSQGLNRALNDGGGVGGAASLLAEARALSADALWLAGRLFAIAADRKLTDEARGWGRLSEAWDAIEAAADAGPSTGPARTGELF